MWAFLIHDQRRAILFGSRDRFGIKHFFTATRDRGHMLFAVGNLSQSERQVFTRELQPWALWPVCFLIMNQLDQNKDSFFFRN